MASDYIPNSPEDSRSMDATWGRSVAASARRNRVRVGEGLVLRRTVNGTVISAKKAHIRQDNREELHPFKVIDASDAEELKVRVLPGLCNFAFPTVNGFANDLTDPAGHLADAPRIDIPDTGYVALVFAGTTPGSPYPASVDIQFSPTMGTGTLPIAKVTVSGGRITQIYQTVFDVVGVAALNYGGPDDPVFMLTR